MGRSVQRSRLRLLHHDYGIQHIRDKPQAQQLHPQNTTSICPTFLVNSLARESVLLGLLLVHISRLSNLSQTLVGGGYLHVLDLLADRPDAVMAGCYPIRI